MADALAIMESLRAGRIQPDHAVVLLMYEARWPRDAAELGVYGPRDMQAMAPWRPMQAPEPCGCDDETGGPDPKGEPEGSVEDLIVALQQQVDDVAARAEEMKGEAAEGVAWTGPTGEPFFTEIELSESQIDGEPAAVSKGSQ